MLVEPVQPHRWSWNLAAFHLFLLIWSGFLAFATEILSTSRYLHLIFPWKHLKVNISWNTSFPLHVYIHSFCTGPDPYFNSHSMGWDLISIFRNLPSESNFYMATSYRCSKSALNQLIKCFSLDIPEVDLTFLFKIWSKSFICDMNRRAKYLLAWWSCLHLFPGGLSVC